MAPAAPVTMATRSCSGPAGTTSFACCTPRVFHQEEFAFTEAFVPAHGGGPALHVERLSGDVPGNGHVPGVPAGADGAEAGHEHHARRGIELSEPGHLGAVPLDILAVGRPIRVNRRAELRQEGRVVAPRRRLNPQRQAPGPDEMVCGERRRDQRLSRALAIEQREHAGADKRLQHDPVPRPVRVACRARELPAQNGANLGKTVLGRRDGVGRDGDRGAPARAGLRDLLRPRDQVQMERVPFAGRGAQVMRPCFIRTSARADAFDAAAAAAAFASRKPGST